LKKKGVDWALLRGFKENLRMTIDEHESTLPQPSLADIPPTIPQKMRCAATPMPAWVSHDKSVSRPDQGLYFFTQDDVLLVIPSNELEQRLKLPRGDGITIYHALSLASSILELKNQPLWVQFEGELGLWQEQLEIQVQERRWTTTRRAYISTARLIRNIGQQVDIDLSDIKYLLTNVKWEWNNPEKAVVIVKHPLYGLTDLEYCVRDFPPTVAERPIEECMSILGFHETNDAKEMLSSEDQHRDGRGGRSMEHPSVLEMEIKLGSGGASE
jgi:hypothetical protein